MVKTARCPACRRKMSLEADACVRCGQPLDAAWRAKHTPPPAKPMSTTGKFMAFLCVVFIGVALFEPVITQMFMTDEEKIEYQAQRAEERAERDAKAAEIELAARNRGDHCRDDGSLNRHVTMAIMEHLHDPHSYTIRNASLGPNVDGVHEYWVEFTANNRLGLRISNQAVLTIRNDDCRIIHTRLVGFG